MVWVCPPQTSISLRGWEADSFAISFEIRFASSGSRYSSTYFMFIRNSPSCVRGLLMRNVAAQRHYCPSKLLISLSYKSLLLARGMRSPVLPGYVECDHWEKEYNNPLLEIASFCHHRILLAQRSTNPVSLPVQVLLRH